MKRHAEAIECFAMLYGAVALIGLPAIAWILLSKLTHQPVPRDLGDDGRSGDGEAFAVAFNNGLHRTGQRRRSVTVDQSKIDRGVEIFQRPGHGQVRRLQNVHRVDLFNRGYTNAGDSCGTGGQRLKQGMR